MVNFCAKLTVDIQDMIFLCWNTEKGENLNKNRVFIETGWRLSKISRSFFSLFTPTLAPRIVLEEFR